MPAKGALSLRAGTLKELLGFLWRRKLWWLAPIIFVLVAVAGLVVYLALQPPLAPFVYTLF